MSVLLGVTAFVASYVVSASVPIDPTPIQGAIMQALAMTAVSVVASALAARMFKHEFADPMREIEQQAKAFADRASSGEDVRPLTFDVSLVHEDSEIGSLARTVGAMADGMKSYANDIDSEEQQIRDAEHRVDQMARLAYRDALTQVKSKAAYDEHVTRLRERIDASDVSDVPVEFSIAMIDLNNLKAINDTYGHSAGNEYLMGSSQLISSAFKQSPVFRIGGDEFAVILQGHDHRHRRQLVGMLEDEIRLASIDAGQSPWKRYSMAIGSATYDPSRDRGYDDVLERADKAMYARKRQLKERDQLRAERIRPTEGNNEKAVASISTMR